MNMEEAKTAVDKMAEVANKSGVNIDSFLKRYNSYNKFLTKIKEYDASGFYDYETNFFNEIAKAKIEGEIKEREREREAESVMVNINKFVEDIKKGKKDKRSKFSKDEYIIVVSPALWEYIKTNKNGREYEDPKKDVAWCSLPGMEDVPDEENYCLPWITREYKGVEFMIDTSCAESEREMKKLAEKYGEIYVEFRVQCYKKKEAEHKYKKVLNEFVF